MKILIILIAFSHVKTTPYIYEEVDLIEVNHYFDNHGKLIFDQIIFYDWSPKRNRFQVHDFRLIKNPSQIPTWCWRKGCYVTLWSDGDLLRKVQARHKRETWTQTDPEFIESSYLAKSHRNKLRKPVLKIPKR